jgi:hypothetical protein
MLGENPYPRLKLHWLVKLLGLDLVEPHRVLRFTWEKLGRSSLFIWTWPGSVIALLEAVDANIRLLVFPFRAQSFQLTDTGTVILTWLVRATLVLLAIFRLWSWWANH